MPFSLTISVPVISSTNPIIDYKGCALSAARSKIAYLSYEEVKSLWTASASGPDGPTASNKDTITSYIFEGVNSEPKYYHDATSGVDAYSWLQGRTLHFVFRGTSSLTDAKIDIEQQRTNLLPDNTSILVHSGFCKQLLAIQTQMLMEIEQLSSMIDAVHFSGHSLGGAVATLAAGALSYACKEMHDCRVICHTVGSPRVGNKEFVSWWSSRVDESLRVQNFKDPIPLFPLNCLYTHIHGALMINDDGTAKIIENDAPWYYRLMRLPYEIYCRNPFANHACDLYIERLLKLADWDVSAKI